MIRLDRPAMVVDDSGYVAFQIKRNDFHEIFWYIRLLGSYVWLDLDFF